MGFLPGFFFFILFLTSYMQDFLSFHSISIQITSKITCIFRVKKVWPRNCQMLMQKTAVGLSVRMLKSDMAVINKPPDRKVLYSGKALLWTSCFAVAVVGLSIYIVATGSIVMYTKTNAQPYQQKKKKKKNAYIKFQRPLKH